MHEFKIEKIQGVPPLTLQVTQFLQNADEEHPFFGHWYHDNIFDNLGVIWTGPDIRVGKSISQEVPAETKFWSYFGYATANFPSDPKKFDDTNWSAPYVAINKSGIIFPDYQDPWSKKKASDGLRTDWVPVKEKVVYTKTERGIAIREFINKYGNPKYIWDGNIPGYKQMHHIKPREFGGTNDVDNFLPIPEFEHGKISGWFNGYGDRRSKNTDPIDE